MYAQQAFLFGYTIMNGSEYGGRKIPQETDEKVLKKSDVREVKKWMEIGNNVEMDPQS